MNIISGIFFLSLIFYVILFLLTIFNKNISSILKRGFLLVIITSFLWALISFLIFFFHENQDILRILLKFNYGLLILFWISVYLFSGIISSVKNKIFQFSVWLFSVAALLFLIILINTDIRKDIYIYFFADVKENNLINSMNIFILFTTIAIFISYNGWKNAVNGITRIRAYYFLQSYFILFAAFVLLKVIKILTEIPLLNFFSFVILFNLFLIYNTISKTRLKRLNIVFGVIFEFVLFFMFMVGVILLLEPHFSRISELKVGFEEYLPLLIIIIIGFPLLKLSTLIIEKFLITNPYNFRDLLSDILIELSMKLQFNTLAEIIIDTLPQKMGLFSIHLYIREKGNLFKKYIKGLPTEETELGEEKLKLFQEKGLNFDLDEYLLKREIPDIEGDWKYIIPLYYHKKMLGFINIIDFYKKNGRVLLEDDIRFLNLISNPISVALKNVLFIEELENKNRRLRKLVNNLNEAQEEITRISTLSALGHMAAGVAHEIRNPLGIIKNSAELLYKPDLPPGEKTEILNFIISEVDRLNTLIKKFLELSTPMELNKTNVNFWEIAEENINKYFRTELDKKGIEIKLEGIIKGPLNIKVDKELISQVINNLIQNAIESIKTENGLITISGNMHKRKEKNYIEIRITDNGSGISKEDLSQVFNPFFTKKDSGVGLGLSLVHKIITAHEGDIKIKSANDGTTVIITLPY